MSEGRGRPWSQYNTQHVPAKEHIFVVQDLRPKGTHGGEDSLSPRFQMPLSWLRYWGAALPRVSSLSLSGALTPAKPHRPRPSSLSRPGWCAARDSAAPGLGARRTVRRGSRLEACGDFFFFFPLSLSGSPPPPPGPAPPPLHSHAAPPGHTRCEVPLPPDNGFRASQAARGPIQGPLRG